jgi:DNA modification methylase|tara:strand:+ start:6357 stop:7028 length:672 start_codon:yes stop_codon:yes gene_type:complete
MIQIETNKIYNEDCITGMKKLPDNSVDLVLTDIPYGEVNRESNGLRNLNKLDGDIVTFDITKLSNELIRVSKGSIYIFCGTEQVSYIRKVFVKNKLSTRLLIWEKTNPSPMNGEHIWLSSIECCVFGKKSGATFNEFCSSAVLREQVELNQKHPTQKPKKLFRRLIKASSNEGDIVLDCCMGSGTTAIACKELNRKYIGFEISAEYMEIINKRLMQECLRSFI